MYRPTKVYQQTPTDMVISNGTFTTALFTSATADTAVPTASPRTGQSSPYAAISHQR